MNKSVEWNGTIYSDDEMLRLAVREEVFLHYSKIGRIDRESWEHDLAFWWEEVLASVEKMVAELWKKAV